MCFRRSIRLLAVGLVLLVLLCVVLWLVASRVLGPSAACRHPATGPAAPGTSARVLLSGDLERCYLLHVPRGHDAERPAPVVLSLHGFASNAQPQEELTGWSDLADREGFLVVYPEGTSFPLRWNASSIFNAADVDDVKFIRDVVADLSRIVAVDADRIYVNGMSNGGFMSHRLACEAADLVAAIGMVSASATDPPHGCTPSRPVPVIAFNGTDDPLVSYEGRSAEGSLPDWLIGLLNLSRAHAVLPAVDVWTADWAERDGCSMVPEFIPASGDASGTRYAGCWGDAEVILYTIDGGGHTWPGGKPLPLVGKTSTDVDATATMWAFFTAHSLSR
jgi:polyhydroxybutyrate depolymerase